MKKEFILQGLYCVNCLSKIEHDANKLEGVEVSINFVTKIMSLKFDNSADEDIIYKKIEQIVHNHEPEIVITEKTIKKEIIQTYLILGLCCTDCADKIEEEINKISGVKNAVVDFGQKSLLLEIYNSNDLKGIIKKVKQISNKIVPGTDIISYPDKEQNRVRISDNEVIQKIGIIKFTAAAILFIAGIVFRLSDTTEFIIFFISYLTAGGNVLLKAAKNITKGRLFDENFLMSIATIGAFFIGEFSEGAAVMLFYQIGEIFQSRAVNRSRKSVSALLDIRPDYANIERDGKTFKVPVEEVNIAQIIKIKPGEKVPLDGIVISGSASADTSALTGESLPRYIKEGDEILSGFININGLLTVKVTKNHSESTVYKIIEMVENSSNRKAQTEKFITKFAQIYTPAVVILALLTAFIPPMVIQGEQLFEWVYRSLVFLVISCPCALVISIPLAFFMGIGSASKNGILIKGGTFLQALCDADTIVFDKTGTLTKGIFKVTSINAKKGYSKDEVLKYAAYAEIYSNHPIAAAVLKAYGKDVDKSKILNYKEEPGQGIVANVSGKRILAGNNKLLDKEKIPYKKNNIEGTVVYIAYDEEFAGSIVISDEIKEDSLKLIKELKNLCVVKTVMLSGDNINSAERVGRELGIDEAYADLLPADKLDIIERMTAQKKPDKKIIFVGDGINDAPALARADISVAMGALGSDAAIEAADIVIMTDEVFKIASAISIAKYTKKIIWQNISLALGIKGIILILGSLGMASMWEAVFADVGVTLLVILNCLRILRQKVI